ncbi:hypothetical protein [Corynebacterium wankanglinii]|uniref:Helix-turn-helix domain-containing protein n=1 Tax=Corynebacterium wankanglinii TaxID=2735136 RepID=A0A838CG04_9CORY|nr:hypothetical protein [Corynebacterium wankanglinii]MBA1834151.1 hypothetical protein [Corynebacterium wankanglinii]
MIQEMPWAEMMADEIAGQAMVVRDVVSPPVRASDPDPIEEGTAREVAAWLRHLGFTTHRRTIQRWIDEGKLEARKMEDGRVIVRLEEARDLAKR